MKTTTERALLKLRLFPAFFVRRGYSDSIWIVTLLQRTITNYSGTGVSTYLIVMHVDFNCKRLNGNMQERMLNDR